jgi:hypothetical protein
MCANKKISLNRPAIIQNKKSTSKKLMKKKISTPGIKVASTAAEQIDYEEMDEIAEEFTVTVTHVQCTVVVVRK